jgi:hypothetical protein
MTAANTDRLIDSKRTVFGVIRVPEDVSLRRTSHALTRPRQFKSRTRAAFRTIQ